jgi:integral membrane protein (TIGR00529 family)
VVEAKGAQMAEAILGVPVIAKVVGALAVILLVSRFCKHLVIAVAAGALVLGLWSGHSLAAMLLIVGKELSSSDNLLLLLVVFQVIWLSSQMSDSGVMQDLVTTVRGLVSRRAAMAVLPAVIGLLPMPGGALFSAPLVDSVDPEGGVAPQLKARTNHWFRHVWEYWWPLYPGVLLAMKFTGLEVWQFMLFGVPLSLCAAAAGHVFLLRRIGPGGAAGAAQAPRTGTKGAQARALLGLVLPIAVVIGSYAVVRLAYAAIRSAWPGVPQMAGNIPMALGLCVAMLVLQLQRPLSRAAWQRIILSPRAFNMVAIVAMVLAYGSFIRAKLPGGEPFMAQMHAEMADWGIPLPAIIILLPLISGLAMGLSAGFVGASFPIVMSLIGEHPSLRTVLSTTVLAYGFGYMGMLLSPVHVCLIVTSAHFRTSVLRNVAGLLAPAAVMLAATLLMYLALR